MKQYILFFFVLFCFGMNVSAQENNVHNDSLPNITGGQKVERQHKLDKIYVPKKAAMFSAALPGLGQIYNHKWWKVPILYAGFAACAYGINFQNYYYTIYRDAYIDIMDSDPASQRYLKITWTSNIEQWALTDPSGLASTLEKKKDSYRRDRDLMIIVTVGVYILNIIDANVDAHLADFDVSNDLSMNFSPVLLGDLSGTGNSTLGLSLKINF